MTLGASWFVCWNVEILRRSLAARSDQNHLLVARAAAIDVKQLVLVFENEIALVGPDHVTEKLVGALRDRVFS